MSLFHTTANDEAPAADPAAPVTDAPAAEGEDKPEVETPPVTN